MQSGTIAGSTLSWDVTLQPTRALYRTDHLPAWQPLDLGNAQYAAISLRDMQLVNGQASRVPGYEQSEVFDAVRGILEIHIGDSVLMANIGDIDRRASGYRDVQLASSGLSTPPDGGTSNFRLVNLDASRITTATGIFSDFAQSTSKFSMDAVLANFLGSNDITPSSFGDGLASFSIESVRISTVLTPEPATALLLLFGIPFAGSMRRGRLR